MLYPIELLGRMAGSMLAGLGSFVMLAAAPMASTRHQNTEYKFIPHSVIAICTTVFDRIMQSA
ncbi:hypothetical protein [Stutzerimonas stutzeri]|jgi:hypothetical protein|uniref:hypothetical protein n=1 Tax=Stutzerimonas stutzeri TaxID=316 RepID=UPI0009BAFB31|nr:hypothetical protein [Stutzerimonas stutzeri]